MFAGTTASGAFDSSDLIEALEVGTDVNAADTLIASDSERFVNPTCGQARPEATGGGRRRPVEPARKPPSSSSRGRPHSPRGGARANIGLTDTVLDPSVCIGWARAAGRRETANELSGRRRGLLETIGTKKVMGEQRRPPILHFAIKQREAPAKSSTAIRRLGSPAAGGHAIAPTGAEIRSRGHPAVTLDAGDENRES